MMNIKDAAPKNRRVGLNPERKDKVNILMVDDQPAKLLSYEAILADLGENLIKANSGREAMEVLLKNDVAVVLMDVSMPELDGFELADIIRQHPRFEKTAIIFISAVHLTDIDRLKGYQRGAVDYISVPVVPELLRAKVSVFAELHRKNRAMANDCPTWSKETATNASKLIGGVIQQVRSMSHLLHPPLLDEVGLKSALEWYVDGLTKRSGMEVSTDIQPGDFPRLAAEMETTIFRIIQEALTNVLRHSGANKVTVSLIDGPNRLTVAVRDNGKGISDKVMEFRPDGVGIGIGGMRQRVKEFGGELKITNAHPGTLVEVSIPSNLIFRKETTATA